MASTQTEQSTATDAAPPKTEWKRGLKIPPQGVGGYDRSWYPACLSADVAPGEVIGRPFLSGEAVVFRGQSGTAILTAAAAP
ncbi:hypothetical protein IP88_04855 [alpha proteobacterium AAP81b]|nr:hypothetical protein IP88_04855 [alpha proteobacterium AAP81b]